MVKNSLQRWCTGFVMALCMVPLQAADLSEITQGIANFAREFGQTDESGTLGPTDARIDVAFSPGGGADALVQRLIRSSRQSLRLAAYTFTSPAVVGALQDAKRRGVDVAVVVDHRFMANDSTGKSRAALNLLKNAGIATRTNARYAIHHDKFIVVDGVHVETGSFNYSDSAAKRNSENVIVLWNNEKVAQAYLQHWQSRFDQGDEYQSSY